MQKVRAPFWKGRFEMRLHDLPRALADERGGFLFVFHDQHAHGRRLRQARQKSQRRKRGRARQCLTNPKLRELVRKDLFDFGVADADLQGSDACFFCLGVSSAGMSEADYTLITYDTPLRFAETLVRLNPDMVFLHVG